MTDLLKDLAETRQRFLDLVSDVRPELHRYCTRMTGSVFDGEDVVQETLAKASFALAELEAMPSLRPWLFRVAHNTAMDFLRRYDRRNVAALEDLDLELESTLVAADEPAPDGERVEAALQVFAALSPVQRSALALKDVLGLSLEETARTMGLSVAAVKGALSRARANVAASRSTGDTRSEADLERLRRYADLFNARDFDGLRALFGEETRLDVVSRYQRQGPFAAQYFTRYEELAPLEDLRAEPGWVEGQPVLAVFRPASSDTPAYFIQLEWRHERVGQVRDFRYVPYIAQDAVFTRIVPNR
jgi:RNA polymerase sigma-70 factor, ECF subfamily